MEGTAFWTYFARQVRLVGSSGLCGDCRSDGNVCKETTGSHCNPAELSWVFAGFCLCKDFPDLIALRFLVGGASSRRPPKVPPYFGLLNPEGLIQTKGVALLSWLVIGGSWLRRGRRVARFISTSCWPLPR